MTNKEILQADLLDILFENRNKAYGAYALRKNYNQHLHWALGICLALSLALLLMNFIGKNNSADLLREEKDTVIITEIDPLDPKELEAKKPPEKQTPIEQVKDVTIKIVPDEQIKTTEVPTESDIKNALISTENIKGNPDDGTPKDVSAPVNSINNGENSETKKPAIFSQKDAHYPGGKDAFAEFLGRYLVVPDELELGEKKTVLVRFMVDAEGNISKTEIVKTGGERFDKEVIRVLRKMPKWIPAEQNGMKVASYFTQPVVFMAIEQ